MKNLTKSQQKLKDAIDRLQKATKCITWEEMDLLLLVEALHVSSLNNISEHFEYIKSRVEEKRIERAARKIKF